MSINILPQSTIRLITTCQIITSVSTAVKELMENAIDAKASCVQINLMNQGLDLIEVKDDGSGIPAEDVALICQAATTSKISNITDLDSLSSYGFRGEALNALCQIGQLSVTTKTSNDAVANLYNINQKGEIINAQPSHFPNGTTICVRNLFNNLPVRKQYLSSKSRMSEELRKVERAVKSLALIHCKLKVTLSHNKCMIWQKNQVGNLRLSLSQVIPLSIVNNMEEIQYDSPVHGAKIHLIMPKNSMKDISALCMSNMQHAYFLYVNKRPVRIGKIEKMLSKELLERFGSLIPNNKYPVCLLSIEVPSNAVDVNLEPNKTKVLLKDVDELVGCIRNKISEYYYEPGDGQNQNKPINTNSTKTVNEDKIKGGTKRKTLDSPSVDNIPRKMCKSVDINATYVDEFNKSTNINRMSGSETFNKSTDVNTAYEDDSSDNLEKIKNDGGFLNVTETTLSQLPSLLKSKENLSKLDFSTDETLDRTVRPLDGKHSDSFVDKTDLNIFDFATKLKGNTENIQTESIPEANTPSLPVLDDSLLYDSYSEGYVNDVKLQRDSAYNSEDNPLNDDGFNLEIYEKEEVKNGISATQWSKGSVVINEKLMAEPTRVATVQAREEGSFEAPCIRDHTVKSGGHLHQGKHSNDSTFLQGVTEASDSLYKVDEFQESFTVNDNNVYFQASNQEQSLNQSEASVFSTSQEVDNFTSVSYEMRKNIIQNNAGSFSQVASQLVAKSSSLHNSQCSDKTKPTKTLTQKASVIKPNKSMLDFVSKKVIRSYPNDEVISFNINEMKLKLLEKASGNVTDVLNVSSEESDCEDTMEHDVSNLLESSIISDSELGEKWNQQMEMIGNEMNKSDDTFEVNDDLERLRESSNDSSYINSMLLKKHRFRIIGTRDNTWFYMYKKSVGVLNVEHLYKLVTFHKHLRTYQVPCTDLEDCTLLDKHFVHTVLNLDLLFKRVKTNEQNLTLIRPDDRIFSMNGVGFILRKNSRNEFSALLTQVPQDVTSFSSKDCAEMVKLANSNKSLEACRPVKVQKLIQNVTEQYCADHPLRHCREVMSQLMVYWFEHIRYGKCPLLFSRRVMYQLYEQPCTM